MRKIYLISPWVAKRSTMSIKSLDLIKYYLEDQGLESQVINGSLYSEDLHEILDMVGQTDNPIIGVTGYTRERFHAYDIVKKVRTRCPGASIVVGGRHFSNLAEETLRRLPEVDIVVRGEGEVTFHELCCVLNENGDLSGVLGISYRKEGIPVHNEDRPLEDNLDLFRSHDIHHKKDLVRERHLSHTKTDEFNDYFSVHATRGCPNKCVYCSLKATKVRFRSIDKIIQEIEDKIEALNSRNVSFTDSSLTINKKFVVELCNRIIEKKLNIRWRCYSRVNIDIELLRLMKKAGLCSVEIGLESGSPTVLKTIRKNINLDQVLDFCKLAYELDIMVWVFCMVSLPDETYEEALMTISFLLKISKYITDAGLQTTRITPDAQLFQLAKERNIIPDDFDWFAPYETPYKALTRPWDKNLPIFIDKMTVAQIQDVHDRFERIRLKRLATFSTLFQGIKYNFSSRGLEDLTLRTLIEKSFKGLLLLTNAAKNKVVK